MGLQATQKRVPRRPRNDPRREMTRAALIEKAEVLFADAGIEGVSLRQIGAAIGSGNDNVVAYHFGSKEALIEAIFRYRLPAFEAKRAELLAIADREGRGQDLPTLVHALWQPYFEQTNKDGRRTYAAFLASVTRSDWIWIRRGLERTFPVTREIVARIEATVPRTAKRFFMERIEMSFSIVAAALRNCDGSLRNNPRRARDLFREALRIATAAMVVGPDR